VAQAQGQHFGFEQKARALRFSEGLAYERCLHHSVAVGHRLLAAAAPGTARSNWMPEVPASAGNSPRPPGLLCQVTGTVLPICATGTSLL
jgi:hypothetical protein